MLSLIKSVLVLTVALSVCADFWTDRDKFIKDEESQMLGSSINLTDKEKKVNQILMKFKYNEFDDGFLNPGSFAPSQHFFQARPLIQKSDVYKLLQKIPKGAALHGHDIALVSSEYLYKQTYRNSLYACRINGQLRMRFLQSSQQDKQCNWTLLNVLRILDPSYDSYLRSQINLYTENPKQKYKNINDVWNAFQNIFFTIMGLVTYKPVFEDYFYQSLKELYDDNVMYLEFRGTLPLLYDLNGTEYTPIQTVAVYKEVIEKFKTEYPRFKGARFIYAPLKDDNNSTMYKYVEILKDLKVNFPDLLAGFDLVGQEDTRKPINAYLDQIKQVSAMGIDFFFHAGETNWYDTSSDFNLVDAILLGTKRIGHAYAVTKHPLVVEIVKERQIAIEVCPISNQVLLLVSDMRNHPAATLIANGFPIVISYDDPTLWNGKALSYDFYMAFMGIAGKEADLRLIKQLALNSLLFSSLPADQKQVLISDWETDWTSFVDNVLATYANEIP
ncbi:hypothetical protein RN001_015114 [Aquatica leii]|uniref:Adenosine deaminase n=1 Tax=Aquatica leii TaxID=1421715 RepID=A0AAN7NVA0_9COLE|nr:hypothetical protein RN001_015114 [Aquatica leii]